MKKIIVLLIFFLTLPHIKVIAKDFKEKNFFIEGGLKYGTVLYHPEHAIYLKDLHYGGLEFRFGKQTTGKNLWERMLNFPSYGVVLRYSSFYNFSSPFTVRKERSKVLGQSIASFGFFQGTIIRNKWFSWNYQCGLGFCFFTKINRKGVVYQPNSLTQDIENPDNYINKKGESLPYPDNCLISLYLTPYVNLQTGFNFQLTHQLDLCLNVAFNHASNANMNMPNYGVNEIQGIVNLRYYFNKRKEFAKIDSFPKFKQGNSLFFTIDPGWLVARYDGNYYLKTGISLGYVRSFLPVVKAGMALEAYYVRYLAHSKEYLKEEWEKPNSPRIPMPKNIYIGAIFGFTELVFDRYAIQVGIGLYLFKGPGRAKKMDLAQGWENKGSLRHNPIFYEKLGFKIYLDNKRHHFIGASLRAHAPVADYMAFDYGFQFYNFFDKKK